jgi:tetratricopeptide (TPR) repeat protein
LRAAQIAKYLGQDEQAESALHRVVKLSSTMPAHTRTIGIVIAHWQALCLLSGMASNQHDFASAEAFLRQGLSLVHTLPDDKPMIRDFLRAEILRSLGIEAEYQDQLREAGRFFQQAVQLVEQYPADGAEEKRLMQIRAKAHGGYAIHCKQMKRFDEALTHFGKCQAALETLFQASSNSAEIQEMLAQNQYNLGNLHLVREEYETARSTYLRAKDDYKRLSERFPQIPRFRERWCNCLEGASLSSPLRSQVHQRLVLRNKAAFLRRELQREFPQNVDNAQLLARVNRHLSQDHSQLLEYDKARQCLLRSLDCIVPPYPSMEVEIDDLATDAWACSLKGHLEMKCQDWDAARRGFQQAIDTRKKCPQDNVDALDNLRDHASLGLATMHAGRIWEGLQMVQQLDANSGGSEDTEMILAEALLKAVQILDNDASAWSSSPPIARETLVRQIVSHLKSAWQAGKIEAKDLMLNEFQPVLQDSEEYHALVALMSR